MTGKIPKATHQGTLQIADTKIPCAVLNDGTRVISRNSIFKAFKRTKRGRMKGEIRVPNMPSFIDAKNLQPFILSDLRRGLELIDYESKHGATKQGYKAEILPLLCDVYLKAREAGNVLKAQQEPLAKISEILVRSLSKVGIVALVDEATGYEKVRDKEALHKLLAIYVTEEYLPWIKTFPNVFYEELFRLRGWTYDPKSVKRPILVGKLTLQLVYGCLPQDVLAKIKEKTPRDRKGNLKKRLFQSLTKEVGKPHLEKHLAGVITLMKISPTWRIFKQHFARAYRGQLELDLGLEE